MGYGGCNWGAEWTEVNRTSQQPPTRLGKGVMHHGSHRDRGQKAPCTHEHASSSSRVGEAGVGLEWKEKDSRVMETNEDDR